MKRFLKRIIKHMTSFTGFMKRKSQIVFLQCKSSSSCVFVVIFLSVTHRKVAVNRSFADSLKELDVNHPFMFSFCVSES